ncbi:MAG TPA: hypothetical protein PKD86_02745 [Gemmatales bacterium]|nr:hypothetical protein [Gemmatales bacterium]
MPTASATSRLEYLTRWGIVALGLPLLVSGGCSRSPISTKGLVTVPSVAVTAPAATMVREDRGTLSGRSQVLYRLGLLGRAYQQALKSPPGFWSRNAEARFPPLGPADLRRWLPADFADLKSPRDGQPFVIIWGVDLDDLPVALQDTTLLAWESTPDPTGQRCVLFANGHGGSMEDAKFQEFRRAKPRHAD